MQALVYYGKGDLRYESVATPILRSGEVLIKVEACGICGSDLHGYLGHSPRRNATIPLIMGHEISGRIAGLGENVPLHLSDEMRVIVQPQFSCGICPACLAGNTNVCPKSGLIGIERHGGFAEFVAVPADRVFPIPDDLSAERAAMVETLAVEVHAFERYVPPHIETLAVIGAGAQGLLVVQLAKLRGIPRIIVLDLISERLELAKMLGATHTIDAHNEDAVERVLHITEGWGADVVIDAAGGVKARQQGVRMLAPAGICILIGLGKGETEIDFNPVIMRGQTLQGSYTYTDTAFQNALSLLISEQIMVDGLLTTAPLAEGVRLFRQLTTSLASVVRVMFKP